jgi:2-iminobutanoate/2-iminopropanoate deaminase
LYISGQVPLNPITGKLINDDIKAATQQVMENLGALLNAADMGFDDVVKCSIFMKDLGDFQEMNAVYGTYFKTIPPARETIEIARLPLDAIIEISCIAIK